MADIRVAAKNMRDRAIAARRKFVESYYRPAQIKKVSVSTADLIRETGLRPRSDDDLAALIKRKPFVFEKDRISNKGKAVVAEYEAQLEGQTLVVAVSFGPIVRATSVVDDSAAQITFALPIRMELANSPGLPIAGVQYLRRFSADDDAIVYELTDGVNGEHWRLIMDLNLDGGRAILTYFTNVARAAQYFATLKATRALQPYEQNVRTADFLRAAFLDNVTCVCNGFTAQADGIYALKTKSGCSSMFMRTGDSVSCILDHRGPFQTMQEAIAAERQMCPQR